MNTNNIEQIAEILRKFELTRIEYEGDGTRIVLEKFPMVVTQVTPAAGAADAAHKTSEANPAETWATTADAANPSQGTPAPDAKVVEAPLTGLAYRTKEPGAPPFVEVGSEVKEGDVLCLIEAMKMFSEVKASAAGRVTTIHFENAELVEKGAPLVSLE